MISGIFHKGSGIGNQLFRYVATRVLALDKGYDFGMVAPELCKVKDFMKLDMGIKDTFKTYIEDKTGRVVPYEKAPKGSWGGLTMPVWEEKTKYYNPEFNFIEDNTIIDGEFQDERYFGHRIDDIDEWLKVEPLYPRREEIDEIDGGVLSFPGSAPNDLCVIGFRGGEFYVFPELGLPKSYFEDGIEKMKKINPNMKFEVHTDDPKLAKQFFPDYKIIQDAGVNWRSMRYAKYAVIANSSFYILPRLLRHRDAGKRTDIIEDGAFTVAPRFWARRNTVEWSMPSNFYKSFTYI